MLQKVSSILEILQVVSDLCKQYYLYLTVCRKIIMVVISSRLLFFNKCTFSFFQKLQFLNENHIALLIAYLCFRQYQPVTLQFLSSRFSFTRLFLGLRVFLTWSIFSFFCSDWSVWKGIRLTATTCHTFTVNFVVCPNSAADIIISFAATRSVTKAAAECKTAQCISHIRF